MHTRALTLSIAGPIAQGVLDLAGPFAKGMLDLCGPCVQGMLDLPKRQRAGSRSCLNLKFGKGRGLLG